MTIYTISAGNLHIVNSYLFRGREFRSVLAWVKDDATAKDLDTSIFDHRSVGSMVREWSCHNLCYKLGIQRARTSSVDLDYPQKWYVSLAYDVLGFIARIFV